MAETERERERVAETERERERVAEREREFLFVFYCSLATIQESEGEMHMKGIMKYFFNFLSVLVRKEIHFTKRRRRAREREREAERERGREREREREKSMPIATATERKQYNYWKINQGRI